MNARIDDPALDVDATSVLVLRNAGPHRRAGHARVGPAPRSRRSCSQQGVRDMVRISDARMSGTSYGACVLHVAPESYVGGPLALVRDGDIDPTRRGGAHALTARERRGARRTRARRGRRRRRSSSAASGVLYSRHVMQADVGCDFDFLEPTQRAGRDAEPEIH